MEATRAQVYLSKQNAWSKRVQQSAPLAAGASLLGALGLFKLGQMLTRMPTISESDAILGLASLAVVFLGIGFYLWFSIALIGFQFRALQFAGEMGQELGSKPGFYLASWFIPFANFFIPLRAFRVLTRFAVPEDRAASFSRKVSTFWFVNVGLNLVASIAGQGGQSANPTVPEMVAGISVMAACLALQAIPTILARNVVEELNDDLNGKISQAG